MLCNLVGPNDTNCIAANVKCPCRHFDIEGKSFIYASRNHDEGMPSSIIEDILSFLMRSMFTSSK